LEYGFRLGIEDGKRKMNKKIDNNKELLQEQLEILVKKQTVIPIELFENQEMWL
jgi:hypothetical protein